MGTLNIPGLGAFTVDDSFGKLSREEQQNIVSELRESYAAKNVASDIQRNAGAGQPDYSKKSAGELAKTAASNIPRSAVQFGESVVQPVLHPVQTAENLAAIGKGVMQKLGVISGKDATQYADAVG